MIKRKNPIKHFFKNTQGVAAIEAAIALPVFVGFIMAIVFLGHAIMIRQSMFYALDHASREVMLNPAISDADIENAARAKMTGFNADLLTFQPSETSNGGVTYKVLSSSYNYRIPFITDASGVTLTATVSVPMN